MCASQGVCITVSICVRVYMCVCALVNVYDTMALYCYYFDLSVRNSLTFISVNDVVFKNLIAKSVPYRKTSNIV